MRNAADRVTPPVYSTRDLLAPASFLGLLVLALYLLTESSDLRHNGDTLLRWQSTQAMVDHARLWIAHPVAKGTRVAVGLGGHLYVSAYGPGQSIFMIPFYVAGSLLAHLFDLPKTVATLYAARSLDMFLGAALAVLLFLMGVAAGYSRRVAAVVALLFAFATGAWPDAQTANEHTQVSLFLLLSVYAAWRFTSERFADRRWLLLCGFASGLTIFTRYDAVIFIPVVAIWLTEMRRRAGGSRSDIGRDLLAYGIAIVPWGLGLALWNQLRFGSPFNVALHLKTFGEPPWIGLPGLILSPGKGIIWYIPVLFLLPWAAIRFYHRLPAVAWLFGALLAVDLAFYSNVLYWHGDPAWGPRYLYEVLPYLILPLGELPAVWRRLSLSLRGAAIALTVLSVSIQLSALSVTEWRFWYQLEVVQEHTTDKFNWGPTAYTYYWDPTRSPLLWQFRNVYQVAALDAFGRRQYRLFKRPTACTGPLRCLDNPAHHYPLNTLVFWWVDIRHPLFSAQVRAALAIVLLAIAAGAGVGMARSVSADETRNSFG